MKIRFFDFENSIKITKLFIAKNFDESINSIDDSNIEMIANVEIISRNSFFNALLFIDTEITDLKTDDLVEFHRRIFFVCFFSRILYKSEIRFMSEFDSDINLLSKKDL